MMSDKVTFETETKLPYRWSILALSWFIFVCHGLVSTTLSAIVTPVRNDLNLSYSQMGFILGIWQLVYTIVALPLGFLIDRIGIYKSLLIASSIIAISAILRSYAFNFETLTIAVALFGVGGSIVSVGATKVVSVWFSGKERGTATGIIFTGGTIGSVATLSLTNSVVIPAVGNWRNANLIYGLFSFLVAAVWAFLGHRSPHSSNKPAVSTAVKGESLRDLRSSFTTNVVLLVIIGVSSFLVSHGLAQWLPTILEQGGMTDAQAGFAVAVFNVFMVLGTLLSTRLPYLLKSNKMTILLLIIVQGISVLAISFVSGPLLWIVLALKGLSGGFVPLISLVLMDLPEVGQARMGLIGGLLFSVGEIGGFGGPALMGMFKDITGTFTVGLVFLGVVCEAMILPAILLKFDKKPKKTS